MKQARKACLIRIASSLGTRAQLVPKEIITLGRSTEADVPFFAQAVSRVHVIVSLVEGEAWIEDQGSANGTRVDGEYLVARKKTLLAPASKIQLGDSEETVQIEAVDIPAELGDLEVQRSMMKAAAHEAMQDVLAQGRAALDAEREPILEAARGEAAALLAKADDEVRERHRHGDEAAAARVVAAQEAAARVGLEARKEATLAKIEGQKGAEAILSEARAKARAELEAAEAEAARMVRNAQDNASATLDDAAAASERTVREAREAAAKIRADSDKEAEATRAKAAQKSAGAAQAALDEAERVLASAREKAAELASTQAEKIEAALAEARASGQREAAEKVARLKQESEEAAARLARESEQKANRLTQESGEKAARLVREAEEKANRLKQESEEKAARLLRESEVRAKDLDAKSLALEARAGQLREIVSKAEADTARAIAARERAVAALATTESEAGGIGRRMEAQIVDARAKAAALEAQLTRLQSERAAAESALTEARAKASEAEAARATAIREAKENSERMARESKGERERALLEAEALKKSGLSAAAGEKLRALEAAKERMLAEERQVQALRRHQVGQMTNQMEILLVPLLRARFPGAAPAALAGLREEIHETARRVLTEDNSTIVNEIERVATFQPSAEAWKKAKRKRAGIAAATAATIVAGSYLFSAEISRIFATESASSASVAADQILREKRRKEKFEPPQIDVYQQTYADNVLYMKDYVVAKTDADFQKKWILDLNQLFVNKLGLSENTIVDFSSAEAGLVRELEALKEKADARTKDETIAKMRALEASEATRLISLVKGHAAYAKVRAFEQEELAAFLAGRAKKE